MQNTRYTLGPNVYGAVIAFFLSYCINKSILWGILHYLMSWWYVLYWLLSYTNITEMVNQFVVRS